MSGDFLSAFIRTSFLVMILTLLIDIRRKFYSKIVELSPKDGGFFCSTIDVLLMTAGLLYLYLHE